MEAWASWFSSNSWVGWNRPAQKPNLEVSAHRIKNVYSRALFVSNQSSYFISLLVLHSFINNGNELNSDVLSKLLRRVYVNNTEVFYIWFYWTNE